LTFCQAKTAGGSRCGRDSSESSYFWAYDPHQRVNKVFHLCQDHSNQIVNRCIEKETGYKHLIGYPNGKLYKQIEHLKIQKHKSSNFSEQRDAIKQAKENGVAIPKFKSLVKIDNEISEVYRKIKKFKELNNITRNHTCRYEKCGHLLKEPNEKLDQIGMAYSHADFHSGHGYRRDVILFHTECMITWLLANFILTDKELKYVRPQLNNQGVLL
jgi:hypothetical protein